MPPSSDELLREARRDDEAVAVKDLPEPLRAFALEQTAQLNKAVERLHGLLNLLELLGLIQPHEKSVPGRHDAPSRFRVCRQAAHSHWCAGTDLASAASRPAHADGAEGEAKSEAAAEADGEAARTFDIRAAEERAEYWEALKAICAERLPKRGQTRGACRPSRPSPGPSALSLIHI